MANPQTGTTSPSKKTPIEYKIEILENSIKEEYGPNTNGTTVLCTVADDDALEFVRQMLGYATRVGSQLDRVLPEKCGWNDTQYAVRCELVKCLTWVDNDETLNNWPGYNEVVYAVTFAAPLYQVLEDDEVTHEHERFVVWKRRGVSQNEKIPGGGFLYVDDVTAANRTPVPEVGVKTGRQVMLQAKWLDVPYVNYAKLSSLANKVNDAAVTWDGVTYDAETVLFDSWDEDKRVNSDGLITVDLTFNFAVRQDGRTWNKFWKNGTDGYVEVSDDGTSSGVKPFASADLNGLFSFS